MKSASVIRMAAAAALLAPVAAHAAALTVVTVSAPAINCVFNASCTVVVDDSVGTLQYTPLGNGAFLQSRTYPGKTGTPGAGTTAYEYRVDLTQATGYTECLAGLVVDFGPVKELTYPPSQPGHVFVTTQGGLGSVGIASAEQDGNVIVFTFSKYLCAGQTSYFFGMAAVNAPQAGSATLCRPRCARRSTETQSKSTGATMRKPKSKRSTAAAAPRRTPARLALREPRLKKIYVYAEGTFVLNNAAQVYKIVIKTPAFDVAGWIDLSSMAPGGDEVFTEVHVSFANRSNVLYQRTVFDGPRLITLGDIANGRDYMSGTHIEIWIQQTTSHNNFATPVEYAYQFVVESA